LALTESLTDMLLGVGLYVCPEHRSSSSRDPFVIKPV